MKPSSTYIAYVLAITKIKQHTIYDRSANASQLKYYILRSVTHILPLNYIVVMHQIPSVDYVY